MSYKSYYDDGDFYWKAPAKVETKWSPSASVSSFFGWSSNVSQTSGWGTQDKLNRVLDEVSKAANMLVNSTDGEEKNFKVSWNAKGAHKIGFSNDSFTISPDIMLDERNKILVGKEYFDALDALNGRVILGAQIRKNIDATEYSAFESSSDQNAKRTFQCVQESKAANVINEEWPGFRPYLSAHAEATHATKKELERFLPSSAKKSQLDNLVMVANHNMMNPEDQIKLEDDQLNQLVDSFNSKVGNSFWDVQNAVNWLGEQLVDDEGGSPSSNSSSDDDGEEGESGGDDSEKDDSKDSKDGKDPKSSDKKDSSSAKAKPKSFDNDLLNSVLNSEIDTTPEVHNDIIAVSDAKPYFWTKSDIIRYSAERVFGSKSDLFEKKCKDEYSNIVAKNRKVIKDIEKVFLFEDTIPAIRTYGLTAGDLDDNSLFKLRMGERDRLFELKNIPAQPCHAVGFLLDQSGSMGNEKMKQAREVLICLLEGLKTYKTIKPVVLGHTAQYAGHFIPPKVRDSRGLPRNSIDMISYVTPVDGDNRHLLSLAPSFANNIDGLAIDNHVSVLQSIKDVENRFLFVISDGQPSADGYDGHAAVKHTRKAIDKARRAGVKVYGIGIANAYSQSVGDALFGLGNHVILRDVSSSLNLLVKKLKQFLSIR